MQLLKSLKHIKRYENTMLAIIIIITSPVEEILHILRGERVGGTLAVLIISLSSDQTSKLMY